MSDDAGLETATEQGVAKELRESPLDIVVHRGKGDDVFVKAGERVVLLDEMEAMTLTKELLDELDMEEA